MSDRGYLFLFSVFVIVASLGGAAWQIFTDLASLDGIFLLLTCGLLALAFALYAKFLLGQAMASTPPPAARKTQP